MRYALHVIGTSFKKTGLDQVAKLQWPENNRISVFLKDIRRRFGIAEIFFLQTCNRREFYFYGPNLKVSEDRLLPQVLAEASNSLGTELCAEHFYHYRDSQVIEHLFKVASSLDSMVLGETEIMKQLKDQAAAARKHQHLGRRLGALAEIAIWTAKQVRHQTKITKNVVSLASLSFRRVTDHLRHAKNKRVVFVGAGHFIQSILPTFTKAPELELTFVSRTKPDHLAEHYGGRALGLEEFLADPPDFDAMVSATAASHQLFDAAWFQRQQGPLLLLDAALPRDIDPAVAEDPKVTYLDLDKMETILASNRAAREAEIPKTVPIFEEGNQKLNARWLECDLSDYHREISSHYQETGERALAHLLKQEFPNLAADDEEKLRGWTQNLVRKLTTIPILGLKGVAKEIGTPAIDAYTRNIAAKSSLFKQQ